MTPLAPAGLSLDIACDDHFNVYLHMKNRRKVGLTWWQCSRINTPSLLGEALDGDPLQSRGQRRGDADLERGEQTDGDWTG